MILCPQSVDESAGPEGEIDPGEGPSRVKLAPLHSLRNHPYRRDPVDDKALRLLRPRVPSVGPDGEIDPGEGPSRVKLATPLHSLRNHLYRREPVDDKTLRLMRPRAP
jgi:hypothetical protein